MTKGYKKIAWGYIFQVQAYIKNADYGNFTNRKAGKNEVRSSEMADHWLGHLVWNNYFKRSDQGSHPDWVCFRSMAVGLDYFHYQFD